MSTYRVLDRDQSTLVYESDDLDDATFAFWDLALRNNRLMAPGEDVILEDADEREDLVFARTHDLAVLCVMQGATIEAMLEHGPEADYGGPIN